MSDYIAAKVDVCVIGAGPHGLALAKALIDAGREVAVVDRETERTSKRQTMLIQPGAIKALDALGVRETIEAATHKLDGYDYYVNGESIAALRYTELGDSPYPYGLGVPYRTMQQAFLDELERHPSFHLFDGATVRTLLKDAYGTLSGVAFTADGVDGERVVECRLVVAADGEGSPTRTLAGISVQPTTWDYEAITFLVPRPEDWPSVLSNYRSDGNRYLGLAAYSPDELSLLWGIRSNSFDEVRSAGIDALRERILSVEPRLEPSLAGIRDWTDVRHHAFPGHIADTWVTDGVMLIGSTAHSLTTFGGQNMNLALYDAASAARTALRALDADDLSAASLKEFEQERRPLVENIAKFQSQAAAPDTDGSGGPAAEAVAAGLKQMFRSMALGPEAWKGTAAPAASGAADAAGTGAAIPSRIYNFGFRYDEILNWAWQMTPKNDPVMTEMGMYAWQHQVPVIGPLSGRLLWQLAKMSRSRRVFEFGSAIGFSTIWLARAVGPGGKVYYTESDEALAERAREFVDKAGVADRVEFLIGDAVESFRSVEGDFDLVLCDIDKRLYPTVLREAQPRLRTGGLFIADNVFWSGACLNGYGEDAMGRGVGEMLDEMLAEPSLFTTLIPLGDGLAVGIKS
ncbi:FAD-dependent oxidoreductase [Streptomyces sp. NPDC101151]|uniref:FAD-dependent oxidoreductase n=1 Tax=Streptomyces sp. NPDC101151 TaxID=3366115 RepID=UPI0037F17B83